VQVCIATICVGHVKWGEKMQRKCQMKAIQIYSRCVITYCLESGLINLYIQSGELRTPEETLAEIKKQIELAKESGGTEKIKKFVASSGICDSLSTSIINHLLELGKQL